MRWAAAHVPLDDPDAVAGLLAACGRRARRSRSPRCCTVIPPPTSPSTTRAPWPGCWAACGRRARQEQVTALADRAAAHVSLDDPRAVARLLDSLREAGAQEQVTALLAVIPPPTSPSTTRRRGRLLDSLREAGAQEQVTALLRPRSRRPRPPRRPGRRGQAAGQPAGGGRGGAGHRAGRPRRRPRLPRRPGRRGRLLDSLREAGAEEQVTALADRAAAHVPLDDPDAVARLLDSLREAGAEEQATALAERAAAHVSLDDPGAVAGCWTACGRRARRSRSPRCCAVIPPPTSPSTTRAPWPAAGQPAGGGRARSRPPRCCAAIPPPTSPSTTRAPWPGCWTACGRRARRSRSPRWPTVSAAHVSLDDPDAVARLLDSLREAGAEEQATALADRLPGAGMFELFREQEGRQDRFRFGREADGSPAGPWGWEDLD